MKRRDGRYVSLFCIMTLLNFIFPLSCSIISPLFQAWGAEKIIIKKPPSGSDTGIMLCTENGTVLYSMNANRGFVPASTLKVLTSLVARYYLGADYRFQTDFFLSSHVSSNTNLTSKIRSNTNSHLNLALDLKIKGYGDPLFTSSIIHDACRQVGTALKIMNISVINDVIVDNSFFASNIEIDGTSNSNNPYDAFTGALSANFNTVSFKYNRATKEYVSDDPEIPLLPFVINRVRSSGLKDGRVVLSKQESELYAGMLIRHFLLQEGVIVKGRVVKGGITRDDKHFYKFTSPYDMDEITRRLLEYSSNFMANQLFLSAGAKAFSPPATVDKGVAVMTSYAKKMVGISLYGNSKSGNSDLVFAEGSGLSRKNRISPADMIKVLGKFKTYYQLMKTENMPDGVIEYYKTGTLNGVRTRCGYFETSQGLYPFVIMINEDGVGYEKVRQFLCKIVSTHERKK